MNVLLVYSKLFYVKVCFNFKFNLYKIIKFILAKNFTNQN